MYRSAVTMFVASTADTTERTNAPTDFAALIIGVISRSRTPAFSTTPPKASAAMTSQIVFSMLFMPPRGDEHINRRIARLRDVPACEGKPCPFEEGEPGRRAIARAREHDHMLRRHEHGKHAAHERTDKDRTERGEFEQSKNDDKDQGNEQDRCDMEGSG